MSAKQMDPSKYKKFIVIAVIATIAFLILAIATRILASQEKFNYTPVTAAVVSATSTISGKNIKVIAEYEGKEYTVRNVTNIFAFVPGTEVSVYLYADQLYVDPASIASDSLLSKMSMILTVLGFMAGAYSGVLLGLNASSKKKIEKPDEAN